MFRFTCPFCNAGIRAKDEQRGQHFRCPKCKEPLQAPMEGTGAVDPFDTLVQELTPAPEPPQSPAPASYSPTSAELAEAEKIGRGAAAATVSARPPTHYPAAEPWLSRLPDERDGDPISGLGLVVAFPASPDGRSGRPSRLGCLSCGRHLLRRYVGKFGGLHVSLGDSGRGPATSQADIGFPGWRHTRRGCQGGRCPTKEYHPVDMPPLPRKAR